MEACLVVLDVTYGWLWIVLYDYAISCTERVAQLTTASKLQMSTGSLKLSLLKDESSPLPKRFPSKSGLVSFIQLTRSVDKKLAPKCSKSSKKDTFQTLTPPHNKAGYRRWPLGVACAFVTLWVNICCDSVV